MSGVNRVYADQLYQVLESMLFIAVNKMYDSPRRDNNKLAFIDIIEKILQLGEK
jgi:hypothetical protein